MLLPRTNSEILPCFCRRNALQTEGCHLYFGIREQKQILIIENRFIVWQNIPHLDLYTFACLHAFEPMVEALLPL